MLATFQYAHNLANALAERGHTVTLVTGIGFETREYERKFHVLEVFDRFIPRPIRIIKFLRFLRYYRPGIVHIQGHSHPTSYLLIRLLIRAVIKTRIVYTAQDVLPKRIKPHHKFSLRLLYRVMDHLFVNAQQNKQILLDEFPNTLDQNISVVPLADLSHFVQSEHPHRPSFFPSRDQVVLFLGNIERRKGLMVLLRAFKHVIEQVPAAYLVAAGKPFDDMTVYRNEVARLGIGAHVTLNGEYVKLEDIPGAFTFSSVLVLPYLEGWNSGVIPTAYTHQRPVICSDIGGFAEVIEDGVTGLLVPAGDELRLAEAIVRVLTDEKLKNTLALGLKTKAKTNTWPQIAEQVEDVYKLLLGQDCDSVDK